MVRIALSLLSALLSTSIAVPPVSDFTGAKTPQNWVPANHIAKLEPTQDGLKVRTSGSDPFLHGPTAD
jgi:hypothetical protein